MSFASAGRQYGGMIRYLLPIAFLATHLSLPAGVDASDVLAAQEGRRRLMVVGALRDDAHRSQELVVIGQSRIAVHTALVG